MDYLFLGSIFALLIAAYAFVKAMERAEMRNRERFLQLEKEVQAEFEEDMPPAMRMALNDALIHGFGAYRQNSDGTVERIGPDELYAAEKEQAK